MKEYKQLGAYGLVIKDNKILLIKKLGGPYDGKLDLPGGTIEFCERPKDTLKRELMEETGIEVSDCQLFDADSVDFEWQFKDDVLVKVHHTGIFFKVLNYNNEIKKEETPVVPQEETVKKDDKKPSVKLGEFVLKIFKPIKDNWGKITLIGSAIVGAGVAFGNWAVNDFSMTYFNEMVEALKQLLSSF